MTESIIERATGNTESTSQMKMLKFHTHFTALELAVASTKAFPGLHLCGMLSTFALRASSCRLYALAHTCSTMPWIHLVNTISSSILPVDGLEQRSCTEHTDRN